MVRIVGLGGSLRDDSTSLKALRLALDAAEDAGAHTQLFDIRAMDLPMYHPGTEPPVAAQRLAQAVEAADGMVWASPLYHGTISGSFKNALDWLDILGDADPPYIQGKVIGLISTAGGVQGLQAINTMEFVVRALRGYAVPLVVPIARAQQALDDDEDGPVHDQLRVFAREVVDAARRMAQEPAAAPQGSQPPAGESRTSQAGASAQEATDTSVPTRPSR